VETDANSNITLRGATEEETGYILEKAHVDPASDDDAKISQEENDACCAEETLGVKLDQGQCTSESINVKVDEDGTEIATGLMNISTTTQQTEETRPAASDMETISSDNEGVRVVAVETEIVVAKKRKVKPSMKHANVASPKKQVLNYYFQPNSMNAKTPVFSLVKEKNPGLLFLEDAMEASTLEKQRNTPYGTPFDFELPAVVADMAARERDRQQIALKRGTPAIKINDSSIRVAVISIVVEAVGSSRCYSKW
jgi:hypothetical protein